MIGQQETKAELERVSSLLREGKPHKARELCQALCNPEQDNPAAWCVSAAVSGQLQYFQEAIRYAKQSIALNPDYADAHFNLGMARLMLRRYREARLSFLRVIEINPAYDCIQQFLGRTLESMGREEEALECYQRTLLENPDNASAFLYVGERYAAMQLADQSEAAIRRSLELSPGNPAANLVMAQIEKRAGRLEDARARLEGLLQTGLDPRVAIKISNELGFVLDRLGDYAAASRAFARKAETSSLPGAQQFDPGVTHAHIEACRRAVSADSAGKWNASRPTDNLPDPIFLVAFPRSGTTLLEKVLSTHTDILTSDEKPLLTGLIELIPELTQAASEYPECLDSLTAQDIARLRQRYWDWARKIAPDSLRGKRFFDKLPLNILETGLINRLFPDAHIILALRDPRDVCLSCWMQLYRLNDAISAFDDLEGTTRLYTATMGLWMHYRKVLDLRLFEVRYESVVADLESVMRPLIDFLGLEWQADLLEYHDPRHYKQFSTPSRHDINSPIFTRAVGRWKNYEPWLGEELTVLAPFVEAFNYRP